MTPDDLQLLRDFRAEIPAPDDETRQRIYAYATSTSTNGWQQAKYLLRVPPLRLRFALPAVAAVCVAAASAVVFTGALGSGGTASKANQGHPDALFPYLTTNVNRSGQAATSVDALVQAPWSGATAQVYVLRNPNFDQTQYVDGKVVSGPRDLNQIVFQEQTSLTQLTSNSKPLPADDKWSSTITLDPSQWDGGCQNAPYALLVEISNPANPKSRAESGSSFFTCNPGA